MPRPTLPAVKLVCRSQPAALPTRLPAPSPTHDEDASASDRHRQQAGANGMLGAAEVARPRPTATPCSRHKQHDAALKYLQKTLPTTRLGVRNRLPTWARCPSSSRSQRSAGEGPARAVNLAKSKPGHCDLRQREHIAARLDLDACQHGGRRLLNVPYRRAPAAMMDLSAGR